MLKRGTQQEALAYLKRVRPGLVVVAPPCTMWSSLQHFGRGRSKVELELNPEFRRKMDEARELLRFACLVCRQCYNMGGVFVFEQPWQASSWLEDASRSWPTYPESQW